MILDEALDNRTIMRAMAPELRKRLSSIRYTVKRYVFDEDASAKAGRFATECADLVCEHAEFAIPPFFNTYIEIDQHASIEASSREAVVDGAASRVGYLFLETGDVLVCSGDPDSGNVTFVPFVYQRRDAELTGSDGETRLVRNFLLGEVAVPLREAVETFAHRLTDIWDYRALFEMPADLAAFNRSESRGDLKRALAAVLLLNQQHGVSNRAVGPRRAIRGGKARTYLAHSVVTVDLSPQGVRGLFTPGNRASPRRHQVEGHFVHYDIDGRCGHQWASYKTEDLERRDRERLGRPVRRWRCSGCGGLRVWREEFSRGDAGKGFVTKEYKVVASDR